MLESWAARLAWLLRSSRARPSGNPPIRTMAVLGSGGHTAEMIQLLQRLDRTQYGPMLYVIATTDSTSLQRVETFERGRAEGFEPGINSCNALLYGFSVFYKDKPSHERDIDGALSVINDVIALASAKRPAA